MKKGKSKLGKEKMEEKGVERMKIGKIEILLNIWWMLGLKMKNNIGNSSNNYELL